MCWLHIQGRRGPPPAGGGGALYRPELGTDNGKTEGQPTTNKLHPTIGETNDNHRQRHTIICTVSTRQPTPTTNNTQLPPTVTNLQPTIKTNNRQPADNNRRVVHKKTFNKCSRPYWKKKYSPGTYTVIRFVSQSAKFSICTVVGLNGTLVETKICTWDT